MWLRASWTAGCLVQLEMSWAPEMAVHDCTLCWHSSMDMALSADFTFAQKQVEQRESALAEADAGFEASAGRIQELPQMSQEEAAKVPLPNLRLPKHSRPDRSQLLCSDSPIVNSALDRDQLLLPRNVRLFS